MSQLSEKIAQKLFDNGYAASEHAKTEIDTLVQEVLLECHLWTVVKKGHVLSEAMLKMGQALQAQKGLEDLPLQSTVTTEQELAAAVKLLE